MQTRSLKSKKVYPRHAELTVALPDPNTSIARMLALVGERKKVLDVGCASGYFANLLVKRECDVVGIDVNPVAVEEARRFCTAAIAADLDMAVLSDLVKGPVFDVIVFGDVLEHLREPVRVLDEARDLLKETGYVVASIPNISHGAIRLALLSGRFDYQDLGILDDAHLRFFTAKTIDELFLTAGFRIDSVERVTLPLFAPTDLLPSIAPEDFDERLVADIRSDPESEILQFVVKAYPLSNDQRLRTISKRFLSTNTELSTAKQQIDRRERALSDLRLAMGSQSAELSSLREEAQRAQNELNAVREEYHKLEDAYRRLERDSATKEGAARTAEELRAANTALQERLDRALDRMFAAQSEQSEMIKSTAKLQLETPVTLERDLAALQKECNDERVRARNMEVARDDLDRQVETLQIELAASLAEVTETDAIRAQHQDALVSLVRLEDEARVVREELEGERERSSTAEADRSSASASLTRVQAEMVVAKAQLDEARRYLERERQNVDRLQISIENLVKDHGAELRREQKQTAEMREAAEMNRATALSLRAEVGALTDQSVELVSDLWEGQRRTAELHDAADALQVMLVWLRKQAGVMADDNARLASDREIERARADDMQAQAEMFHVMLESVHDELTSLSNENAQLRADLLTRRNGADDIRALSDSLEQTIGSEREEIATLARALAESEGLMLAKNNGAADTQKATEAACEELLLEATDAVDAMRGQLENERDTSEVRHRKGTLALAELRDELEVIRRAALADKVVMRSYADESRNRAEKAEGEFADAIRQRDELYVRLLDTERSFRESAQYATQLTEAMESLQASSKQVKEECTRREHLLLQESTRREQQLQEECALHKHLLQEECALHKHLLQEECARRDRLQAGLAEQHELAARLQGDAEHFRLASEALNATFAEERQIATALKSELISVVADRELLRGELAEAERRLVTQAEELLVSVTTESARLAKLIDTVQSSHFWALKGWLARVRNSFNRILNRRKLQKR